MLPPHPLRQSRQTEKEGEIEQKQEIQTLINTEVYVKDIQNAQILRFSCFCILSSLFVLQ